MDKLVALTADLEPVPIMLSSIRELDEPFWFGADGDIPTCRSIADHARLIGETDLDYPIIVDPDDRVMDGMHRVCKAYMESRETVLAYRLRALPEPDFVNVPIDELPYD